MRRRKTELGKVNAAARANGMTYGQWVARTELPGPLPSPAQKHKKQRKPTKHEAEIMQLWKTGMKKAEIAERLGMNRNALYKEMDRMGIYTRRDVYEH